MGWQPPTNSGGKRRMMPCLAYSLRSSETLCAEESWSRQLPPPLLFQRRVSVVGFAARDTDLH